MARYRFDTGTDIATVGIWNASLPALQGYVPHRAFEEAAVRGEVLPVRTSADGGFDILVLVDEAFVPPDDVAYTADERELGLDLTSGEAFVGGCEDFRNPSPQITSESDRVHLAPSWYGVRVHACITSPERLADREEEAVEKVLTPAELALYRRSERRHGLGCNFILLALAVLAVAAIVRGRAGLVGLVLGAAALVTGALLSRTGKVASLTEVVERARDSVRPPDLVLELRRTTTPLPGGCVELEALLDAARPAAPRTA